MAHPPSIFVLEKDTKTQNFQVMNATDRKVKKVHLTNFHIAGFGYWEGCEAFENLKIGSVLELVREDDNKFDPYAVAIYFGAYKLGFIPRGENHDISKFLDMGHGNLFEVRITKISPDVAPENQVEVIVYIKKR